MLQLTSPAHMDCARVSRAIRTQSSNAFSSEVFVGWGCRVGRCQLLLLLLRHSLVLPTFGDARGENAGTRDCPQGVNTASFQRTNSKRQRQGLEDSGKCRWVRVDSVGTT